MDTTDIITCSRCHCRHRAEDFGINRLGNRWKTCVACRDVTRSRSAAYKARQLADPATREAFYARTRASNARNAAKYQCEHNQKWYHCRECNPGILCEHGKYLNNCRGCGGRSFCVHDTRKTQCRECDPMGYLWKRASVRILDAIGTEARAGRSTADILGCNKVTFYHHIVAQFVGEMTWARITEIQIDHRVPIRYPGVTGGPPTLEEMVARLDYRNCQPLWTADNHAKGNRRVDAPQAPAAFADADVDAPQALTALTDADIDAILADVPEYITRELFPAR